MIRARPKVGRIYDIDFFNLIDDNRTRTGSRLSFRVFSFKGEEKKGSPCSNTETYRIDMENGQTLSNTLHDIGQKLQIGNVTDAVSKKLANPSTNVGQLGEVALQVQNILRGVIDITSGNQLAGSLRIVCAVRVLVPIVGPLGTEFARFVFSVLGFAGSGQKSSHSANQTVDRRNTTGMMATNISNALNKIADASLQSHANGACRALSFAHETIVGESDDSKKDLSGEDVNGLLQLINIPSCVETLGKIESRILTLMQDEPETLSEEALSTHCRRIIQYIDMYCHLAILRDAVMLELYAMLRYSGHSDRLAEGIRTGLEGEHKRNRNLVKSLVLPNQSHIRFAAFFDPDHWPFTCKFMEDCTNFHAPENLDKVPVAMHTMKWMSWFANHDIKSEVCLRASESPSERSPDKTKHNFVLLKKEGSTCYYISPQGQKGKYVVMRGGDKKWVEVRPGRPGKEGEWNIFNVEDKDGVYMLSTRRWPVHFMTMSDTWFGWIQGRTVSLSDPSAHWVIQYNGSKA
ncbi:toxin CrTX-A-like [Mizuhopecten yessoensis]|uniref:Toxin CfTX-1 n=1 Tax=Mizuhopecten yessoensis TaxID=6573 RepID=A0A210Q309_MIZYE|nr:toxin CrTX-A-like [Mizuhopecten yessoensis]OWF43049.1 Toxin CfTX-1 [Mizuhopecten yessoensis]